MTGDFGSKRGFLLFINLAQIRPDCRQREGSVCLLGKVRQKAVITGVRLKGTHAHKVQEPNCIDIVNIVAKCRSTLTLLLNGGQCWPA